eukprot:g39162.t1
MLRVYYRPPYSQQKVEERICRHILEKCKTSSVAVAGDFNFPDVDWESLYARGLDGAEFVRTIQEGFLTEYVNSWNREGETLDPILGNEPGE